MKRFSLFAAVVLCFCLTLMPVNADESYVIKPDSVFYDFFIPEGMYHFQVPDLGIETEPVSVLYTAVDPSETNGQQIYVAHISGDFAGSFFATDIIYDSANNVTVVGEFILLGEGSGWDWDPLEFPYTIEIVPVPSQISPLVAIANSISFSGVLTEVTSILPIAIIVLVSFIGIRKGISFLVDFIRGS